MVLSFKAYAQNPSIDLAPERRFTDSYEDGENHISDFTNKNYRKGNIKKAFKIIDCLVKKDTVTLFNFGQDGWRTSKTEIYCLDRKKTIRETSGVELINDCFILKEKISFIDSFGNKVSGRNIYEFNKQGYVIRLLQFDSTSKDTYVMKYGYDKYNRIRYSIESYRSDLVTDRWGNILGNKRREEDTSFYNTEYYYRVKDDTLIVTFSPLRYKKVYYYNPQGKLVRMEFDYPCYVIKTTKTKRTLRHLRRKKIETLEYTGKSATKKITETIDPEMKFIYY